MYEPAVPGNAGDNSRESSSEFPGKKSVIFSFVPNNLLGKVGNGRAERSGKNFMKVPGKKVNNSRGKFRYGYAIPNRILQCTVWYQKMQCGTSTHTYRFVVIIALGDDVIQNYLYWYYTVCGQFSFLLLPLSVQHINQHLCANTIEVNSFQFPQHQ